MKKSICILLLCAGFAGVSGPALAQGGYRSNDPNIGHFYMARQEWQYIDNSPVVTGQPGSPGAAGQGAMPPAAAPAPLPKAGWVPYSSTIPSVQNALPKVNNGVPKPMPAAAPGPSGQRGKAGSLNLRRPAAAAAPAGPPAVKSYAPYKGYGGGSTGSAASGGAGYSSSTQVKGSVLHFTRPRASSY